MKNTKSEGVVILLTGSVSAIDKFYKSYKLVIGYLSVPGIPPATTPLSNLDLPNKSVYQLRPLKLIHDTCDISIAT